MTSPCRLTWLQHVGTGFQWRRESRGSLAVAVVSGGAATERVKNSLTCHALTCSGYAYALTCHALTCHTEGVN